MPTAARRIVMAAKKPPRPGDLTTRVLIDIRDDIRDVRDDIRDVRDEVRTIREEVRQTNARLENLRDLFGDRYRDLESRLRVLEARILP